VLHGGGNTSVKAPFKDIFGKDIPALYVKGSGWDLATIEKEGFAPVSFPRPAFAAMHASFSTWALRLGACVSVLSGDSCWKAGCGKKEEALWSAETGGEWWNDTCKGIAHGRCVWTPCSRCQSCPRSPTRSS